MAARTARAGPGRLSAAPRRFRALGGWVTRHPGYPIVAWIALLILALPLLGEISQATSNSATNLPHDAPSQQASAEIARLFPNDTSPTSSEILLQGPNISGVAGQALSHAISERIALDPKITEVDSVDSLYSSYATDLVGLATIALPVISDSAPNGAAYAAVNATGQLAWPSPAYFLTDWQNRVDAHPGTPASQWNPVAENDTLQAFRGNPAEIAQLSEFYGGPGRPGFNGTEACASDPSTAARCAAALVAQLSGPVLEAAGIPLTAPTTVAALTDLGPSTYDAPTALTNASIDALVSGSAISPSFVGAVARAFPGGSPGPLALAGWADGIAWSEPVDAYPAPIPTAVRSAFVDPANDAMLITVDFALPQGSVNATGADPVAVDVGEIDAILAASVPSGGPLSAEQTGEAALDVQESNDLNRDIAIVLPLTLIVLMAITIVYFRAPLTPLITFGGLGLALGLSFAGVVLIGRFVTKVDPTSLTLATTFVLGVGTDYSIFLVARYREELLKGTDPREAVITSVEWAGQSIATSGATAIIATLALAFSGVAILSQWGIVLSLSVLITLLASLTLVPAALVLIGPRLFWPSTGERFKARVVRERARRAERAGYFDRAGRLGQRRPRAIVAIVLVASIPLLTIALQVPLGYDFFGQLPSGEPASDGLRALEQHFGAGSAFPSFLLVTFRSPLLVGHFPNATEFTDLAAVASLVAAEPGVATVDAPVSTGATLSEWLAYPNLTVVQRETLRPTLSGSLGTDGRTVLIGFTSTASGLSREAIRVVDALRTDLDGFVADHPAIVSVAYGGGAQTTSDLEAETALATERMIAAVTVGLVLVLLAVLRSWIIPLMAVGTIGLSIGWSWAITYLVVGLGFGDPIFYFVPTVLFILILGLGIDYNIFLLTRVREERLRGRPSTEAAVEAVARTGGIITAAAIILASAFAVLISGRFLLLQTIGFSVAVAIVLDAMVVRTYLVPAALHLLGERVWRLPGRLHRAPPGGSEDQR